MIRRILGGLALTSVGWGAVVASVSLSAVERRDHAASVSSRDGEVPIDRLDRCIQRRLHDSEGFGFSRLADVPQHLASFVPETAEETSTLDELRWAGRDVVLYLGGLGLLDPKRDSDNTPLGRRAFSGAVVVSCDPSDAGDLPPAPSLRLLCRRALADSPAGGPVVAAVGRWRIDIRPVRADRQACLDCHNPTQPGLAPEPGRSGRRPLQIGDALGVVVYASSNPGR